MAVVFLVVALTATTLGDDQSVNLQATEDRFTPPITTLPVLGGGSVLAGFDLFTTEQGDTVFLGFAFEGVPLGTFAFPPPIGVKSNLAANAR